MTEPRQLSELDLQRAALGHPIRSSHRPGRQPQQGPVTVSADFHVQVTKGDEQEARRFLVAFQSALLEQGADCVMDGPAVVPVAGPQRRRVQ